MTSQPVSETASVDMVRAAIVAIEDKQGVDIAAFDLRGRSNLTDFCVIVTGMNPPHLKALFMAVRLSMKALGRSCYRQSGAPESGWIVADYIDIMIHFFSRETREYYALDEIFEKTPRLRLK